jgi:hypothetical protein
MEAIKRIAKSIYNYWRKRWIKAHFQKFKAFNRCLQHRSEERRVGKECIR